VALPLKTVLVGEPGTATVERATALLANGERSGYLLNTRVEDFVDTPFRHAARRARAVLLERESSSASLATR
jgi:hypothetical protein